MLNYQTLETNTVWNRLQAPARPAHVPADYLLLLSALDEGWTITDVVRLLAHGRNDEGRSYIVTLMHPHRLQVYRMTVAQNAHSDALLESEGLGRKTGRR